MPPISVAETCLIPSLVVKFLLDTEKLRNIVPRSVPESTRVLRKRPSTRLQSAASKMPKLDLENDRNGEFESHLTKKTNGDLDGLTSSTDMLPEKINGNSDDLTLAADILTERTGGDLDNTPIATDMLAEKMGGDLDDLSFTTNNGRETTEKTDGESDGLSFAANNRRKTTTAATPYYNNKTARKPAPYGMPAVWANKRQQLCETLPQYKAYQSGAYHNDHTLYGFLIDAEVGSLDVFDDQIIITTVGGDRAKDKQGNKIQNVSSDTKAAGLAAMKARKEGTAVLMIAGQGNNLSPSRLPHYYNVLGWFKVTDVWRETDKKTWKIRFEKIDLTERSWWAAQETYAPGTALLSVNYASPKAAVRSCEACHQTSKEIYEQGWVCLHAKCKQFFEFANAAIGPETLSYTKAFLQERSLFIGQDPGPLAPALPTQEQVDQAGTTAYDRVFRNGIVCPQCGCCSRRVLWHQWKCENEECDFTYSLSANTLTVDGAIVPRRHPQSCHQSIRTQEFKAGLYNVHEYILPGPNGTIAGWIRLFKSNGLINQQPDGPNDLFKQMQQGHFKLERHPVRCKDSIGQILTSHFASNWGAIYKYGVTPTTTGFSEAPPVIFKALKRLTWAGEHALNSEMDEFKAFNELLALGYFEEGSINFHDDGETTLGPTVATLSLGADATMKFRPKKKSSIGVPGKSVRGNKSECLKITLNHGDLLVMHGTGIHREYEHAVFPHGKLRFALTSRFVIPEKMNNKADREFARIGGILPEGHEQYDYDGDVNAQPIITQTVNQPEPVTQAVPRPVSRPVTRSATRSATRSVTRSVSQATTQSNDEADDEQSNINGDATQPITQSITPPVTPSATQPNDETRHEDHDMEGHVHAQAFTQPHIEAERILSGAIEELSHLGLSKREIADQLENAAQKLSVSDDNPHKRRRMN